MKKIIISIFVFLVLISFTYADCSALNDAKGYYAFTSDCITDSSINGNDGTNNGATNTGVGILGNGCHFEQTESDSVTIDVVTGAWVDTAGSMCGWGKMESFQVYGGIVGLGNDDTGNDAVIEVGTDATDSFMARTYINPTVNIVVDGDDVSSDTNWHFACITWDASGYVTALYYDGTDVGLDNSNALTFDDVDAGEIGGFPWRNGVAGFWDGDLDEISIYDYQLTNTQMGNLYNGGSACNPYDAVTPTLTLNTALVNNTNSTANPFEIIFNGTVSDTTDLFNCSFFANEVLEDTMSDLPLNNTNRQFNFSDGNGFYNFSVNCSNNQTSGEFTRGNIFIDTIEPTIQDLGGFTNNSFYVKGSDILNLKTNYSDSNLEAINFTIFKLNSTRGRLDRMNNTFVQDITSSEYIFNFSDDLSSNNWTIGDEYEVERSAWDGHTTNELIGTPTKVINKLYYRNLKFYCDKALDMDWELTRDSVKPIITFTTPAKKQTCYYETTGEWHQVKRVDEKLSMWYVDLKNRLWIDEKHENIETDLLTPQLLKVVYTFDKNIDYFKSESFGDLNFNSRSDFFIVDSFTSYEAVDVSSPDVTVVGDSFQLINNITINVTKETTFFIKTAFNSQKTNPAGTNVLYGNITIDGEQIFSGVGRTMTGTSIGVSGQFLNFTRGVGSYNIEIWARETGSGNVDLFNIDYTILSTNANNDEEVCNLYTDLYRSTISGTGLSSVKDFQFNNTYESEIMVQSQLYVNSSNTNYFTYYINDLIDGDNSTIITRYLSSITDRGSLFNVFIDEGLATYRNFSILGINKNNVDTTIDGTTLGLCLRTINGSKINFISSSNPLTNLTDNITISSRSNLITSDIITIRNGTQLFIEGSISFKSDSGTQTPTLIINSTIADCQFNKQRTLSSSNDIGNAFLTGMCNNFTLGQMPNISMYVEVESGETVTVIDEILTAFESTILDVATVNVPPTISITSNIQSPLYNGIDATMTIQPNDVNGDNVTLEINWSVNGVITSTESRETTTGTNEIFTFSSGSYTTGQFVNATITGFDGVDFSNIVYSATREVEAQITEDTLLLANISQNLEDVAREVKMGSMTLGLILLIIAFFVIGIMYDVYGFWALSGIIMIVLSIMQKNVIQDSTTDMMGLVLFFLFIMFGIILIVFGIGLQINTMFGGFMGKEEENSMYGGLYETKKKRRKKRKR